MKSLQNLPDRIFLCGFMGAGKSTLGTELANLLECPFADLDDLITERAGMSIPELFEKEGESAFRTLERQVLLDATREFEGVLALGGGSLQKQPVVDHLKINGLLIFIDTPFSVIFERITRNRERPLLLDDNGNMKDPDILQEELKLLYNERLGYYRQAEITLNPESGASAAEQAGQLARKIRNHVSFH